MRASRAALDKSRPRAFGNRPFSLERVTGALGGTRTLNLQTRRSVAGVRHAGSVHVLLDGYRVKTLPSRLNARDLAHLAAAGARRAGPPPLPRHLAM